MQAVVFRVKTIYRENEGERGDVASTIYMRGERKRQKTTGPQNSSSEMVPWVLDRGYILATSRAHFPRKRPPTAATSHVRIAWGVRCEQPHLSTPSPGRACLPSRTSGRDQTSRGKSINVGISIYGRPGTAASRPLPRGCCAPRTLSPTSRSRLSSACDSWRR